MSFQKKNAHHSSNTKESPLKTLFEDFDWGKFASSVAVAAAAGGAYSVFDQTILHRKKPGENLPRSSDILQVRAPDILKALERFYRYRNTLPDQKSKNAFKKFTVEVMRQSEYIAAVYNKCAAEDEFITPDMHVMRLFHQLRDHTRVVVEYLRSMLVLIPKDDDVDLEHAFNALYECYHNRLFNMESKFR